MRIEIFKAGTHTDSAGNSRTWTEADLDTIVSKYDPANHEAPACIGHPEHNAPAYGWVKSVSREGSRLFAEFGDMVDEFSEMLKKKMFKKRSIALYPDLSLRHVGFLGAQPPAIKGLKDFAFSEAEKGTPINLEFADWSTVWGFRQVAEAFQGFREWLIETKDKETADRFIPQYNIDTLKTMQAEEKSSLYTEETDMTPKEFQDQLDAEKAKTVAAEAKAATFSEQLTAEKTKVTNLTNEIAGTKSAAQEKEFADFCEGLRVEGKIVPARIPAEIAVMKSLAGQAEIEFSDGDKAIKKTPLAMYQERLKSGPKVIEFGEQAVKSKAQPTQPDDKLTALTKEKMAANKGMEYAEAGRQVLMEHPELNYTEQA